MRALAVTLATVMACGQSGAPPVPRVAHDRAHVDAAPTAVAKPKEDTHVALGFVLLRSEVALDPDAVIAAYATLAPDGPALTAGPGRRGETLSFDQGDRVAAIGLMPRPVPDGEAEDNARFSFFAVANHWTPPPHAAHLVVMSTGPGATPLERTRNFHRLLAAVTAAAGANVVGVYVGGIATHDPESYVRAVREMPDPIIAWCGVDVVRDGDRLSLLSSGMRRLGVPDVIVTVPASHADHALLDFYDLLLYIARRGTALPEGDTVGRTRDREDPRAVPDLAYRSDGPGDARRLSVTAPESFTSTGRRPTAPHPRARRRTPSRGAGSWRLRWVRSPSSRPGSWLASTTRRRSTTPRPTVRTS
jgi:hypothetical protein